MNPRLLISVSITNYKLHVYYNKIPDTRSKNQTSLVDSRGRRNETHAKVLIQELSGPGVLLNSRFHDNQIKDVYFQTRRQKN